jgi:hypothetical protein
MSGTATICRGSGGRPPGQHSILDTTQEAGR